MYGGGSERGGDSWINGDGERGVEGFEEQISMGDREPNMNWKGDDEDLGDNHGDGVHGENCMGGDDDRGDIIGDNERGENCIWGDGNRRGINRGGESDVDRRDVGMSLGDGGRGDN